MLAVLVSLAFLISIVWLNLVANEVVGVLTALGLLLNIKTGQTVCANVYNLHGVIVNGKSIKFQY